MPLQQIQRNNTHYQVKMTETRKRVDLTQTIHMLSREFAASRREDITGDIFCNHKLVVLPENVIPAETDLWIGGLMCRCALENGRLLWKALAQWMHRSGLGAAPRTLLEEFFKIKSGDVVFPAQMADGSRRTIHLRCVTTPDEAQKVLFNSLGLTLPQRVRGLDELAQMWSRLSPRTGPGAITTAGPAHIKPLVG